MASAVCGLTPGAREAHEVCVPWERVSSSLWRPANEEAFSSHPIPFPSIQCQLPLGNSNCRNNPWQGDRGRITQFSHSNKVPRASVRSPLVVAGTTTTDFLWNTSFQSHWAWNGQWLTPSAVGEDDANRLDVAFQVHLRWYAETALHVERWVKSQREELPSLVHSKWAWTPPFNKARPRVPGSLSQQMLSKNSKRAGGY